MEGEEGVRRKDRTAIHGAVNGGSSLPISTIQTYDRGVDMKAWAHLSQGYTLRKM